MFYKGKGRNKACICNKYCGNTRKYLHHIHSTHWNRFYREEVITKIDILLSRSTSVTDRENKQKRLFLNMHGTPVVTTHTKTDPERLTLSRKHASLSDLYSLDAENVTIHTAYTMVTAKVPWWRKNKVESYLSISWLWILSKCFCQALCWTWNSTVTPTRWSGLW